LCRQNAYFINCKACSTRRTAPHNIKAISPVPFSIFLRCSLSSVSLCAIFIALDLHSYKCVHLNCLNQLPDPKIQDQWCSRILVRDRQGDLDECIKHCKLICIQRWLFAALVQSPTWHPLQYSYMQIKDHLFHTWRLKDVASVHIGISPECHLIKALMSDGWSITAPKKYPRRKRSLDAYIEKTGPLNWFLFWTLLTWLQRNETVVVEQ
jgi:hypothetical protein